jgi:hypothetical protein
MEKWITWIFSSLIFVFQCSHHEFTTVRLCCNFCREHNNHASLLCKYRYQPQTEQDKFQVPWGHYIYIYTPRTYWGKDVTRCTHATISLGIDNSPSTMTINFLSVRKEAISLMRFVTNAMCHVVLEAFSISKTQHCQHTFVEIFGNMPSTSLVHWSVILWSARKPNWLAFNKFLSSIYFFLDCWQNQHLK